MKSEKFPLTITEKGVSAVIRTATKKKAGKTHHYFIVEYITKEGRKQVWRSSEEKAREAAKSACNDILNGKDLSLQLKDSDRMAYVIYLEDSMVLLRWGISRKEALSVGQPFDKDNPIKWEEKILDGQPCELIVNLADGAVFDEARARFHRRHTAAPDPGGLFLYQTLSKHFTEKTGKRPFSGFTEKYGEAPTLSWEHDVCILKLTVWDAGQQGGPNTDLLISKR